MDAITPAFISALASSLGVGPLTDAAAEALGPHLEVRLRGVIQVRNQSRSVP